MTAPDLATVVERLRAEFDQSFAREPRVGGGPGELLALIRVRDDPFALRLQELGGLLADRAISRLPSPVVELRGLAGFRGALVPVFDLGALLGYAPSAAPRWLALSQGRSPIALAFDRFDGTAVIGPDELTATPGHGADGTETAAASPGLTPRVARTPGGPRPVVHFPSLLAAVDRRVRSSG